MAQFAARRLRPFLWPWLAAASCALAQGDGDASTIRQVLVHPGGASVQRVLRVAAGATQVRLNCLPATLAIESLRLSADVGIVLGDVNLQSVDRAAAPECAAGPTDARLRELEDQKAVLQAEHAAQEALLAALRSPPPGAVATSPAALATYADALRRTAQEALLRQHALLRRQQALDEQMAPLRAERDRQGRAQAQVRQLTVRLASRQGGELRLDYHVAKAGWTPLYRAHLDSAAGRVRLERLAQVVQSSGEDWSGVSLRLSTSAPALVPLPDAPRPWTLDVRPVAVGNVARAEVRMEAATSARAPGASSDGDDGEIAPVTTVEDRFDTQYLLPGPVHLRSDGQQLSFVLDAGSAQTARILTRVQPQQALQGWLIAEMPRPAGDWPAGPLQLYRDGTFVGQARWRPGAAGALTLGFGRDDRLLVAVAPRRLGAADNGLLAKRVERREAHHYTLENQSRQAVTVQVLESSPVPRHDDIRVEARFAPEPLPGPWQEQPGIRVWELPLAAGERATLSADYLISHPRDLRVYERR